MSLYKIEPCFPSSPCGRRNKDERTGALRPDFAFEVDVYVRVVAVGLGLRCSATAESKLAVMTVRVTVFVEEIELPGDLERIVILNANFDCHYLDTLDESTKSQLLCEPVQNGFSVDSPHRQSHVSSVNSSLLPSPSISTKSPLTWYGPSSPGIIVVSAIHCSLN